MEPLLISPSTRYVGFPNPLIYKTPLRGVLVSFLFLWLKDFPKTTGGGKNLLGLMDSEVQSIVGQFHYSVPKWGGASWQKAREYLLPSWQPGSQDPTLFLKISVGSAFLYLTIFSWTEHNNQNGWVVLLTYSYLSTFYVSGTSRLLDLWNISAPHTKKMYLAWLTTSVLSNLHLHFKEWLWMLMLYRLTCFQSDFLTDLHLPLFFHLLGLMLLIL